MTKDLDYYMKLSYPVQVLREPDGVFAFHPDLDGCAAQGENFEEAMVNLDASRRLWLKMRLEDNLPINEPIDEDRFNGRISLRTSPWLHSELVRCSRRSNVSVNQLITTALSEYLGGRRTQDEAIKSMSEEIKTLGSLLQAARWQQPSGRVSTDSSIGSIRGTSRTIPTALQHLEGTTIQ